MTSFSYRPISGDIRLLTIQPGHRDASLACQLQDVVLNEQPAYEALSYTWGDANDRRPITLDGFPWDVTANLDCALRHLRHQDKPRIMWIDALCINQADMDEKAEQIPKMRIIYTSATKVVIWLGPAGDDGDAAMEGIQHIATKFRDLGDVNFHCITPDDLRQAGIDVTNINWPSVWSFLNRPYWQRIWVLQELAACSIQGELVDENDKGVIVCGSKSISKFDYELFTVLLLMISRSTEFAASGILEGQEPARSFQFSGFPLALHMGLVYSNGNNLPMLLWCAPRFKASVPHDMVYALLGLATGEESALVIPDYSKPIESVYAELYLSLMLHSKSLASILFNRINHDGRGPSWILDLKPRLDFGSAWVRESKEKPFEAATNVPMDINFDNETRYLAAKGIKIGVLDVVVGPHSQITASPSPGGSEEQPGIAGIARFTKFYQELKAFSQTLSVDEREGFWRITVMDYDLHNWDDPKTPAPQHFAEEFEVAMGEQEIPADYGPDLSPEARRQDYFLKSKYVANLTESTRNRCFFRTTSGKMGLGPYDSKKGDVVAALFGAERFLVLRPISTGYELVGDAYVQGGMFGEFLSAYLNGDRSVMEEFILC